MFPSLCSFTVISFSNGSIVNNINLEFATASAPNKTQIVNVLVQAVSNITVFIIDTDSVVVDVTYPENADGFRASRQDETSITLQWNKINNNISFVLQFNGTETFIRAPDGDGPVNHTVSSLTAGTKYTFTLFSEFENVRSSGVQLTAATAPGNPDGFRASSQDESSITLEWNKINNYISFVLQFNGRETFIRAPDVDEPVSHTVSSLSAGTKYTFTLFSEFNDIRSSGVNVTASTSQIRLTGAGFSRCSGRVEVYHNSTWGTVCDDYWGLNDANVVCRELNCGTAVKATSTAFFGQGTGQIWLDDVSCSGYETSLTQCGHRGFGVHDCGHNDDAGVICSGQIRLAGAGSPRCSGRVEVYHNNIWGTVCDDYWDLNDANVVCRELNCGTALKATSTAFFGQGTGEIWLDDVSCSGNEASLTQCGHRGFGIHDCGHWEDAGVICSAPGNPDGFRASSQDESSITLQWNKINNYISFVLQFNGRETFIRAPDGDGPVSHTVSSLSAGTKYTFTLFSEFNDIRSSGVNVTASTSSRSTSSRVCKCTLVSNTCEQTSRS
ncbi:T-cell differentiation antigen CD6-like isoform X2 [Poecilia latipinna]|uniref:T-cell differentiation antigen CD6-like isoform X2 n=1 Tax=Poecilia latipinna TaxID=48699 RepID=UPI00072E9AF0|nr:PREDICTED: T-cell differentiation antigen CD6-like isoform X2 [Poecilia latipinna]